MKKACVKCKYAAWCLPRKFCTYDANKCRPLYCENCGNHCGTVDVGEDKDITGPVFLQASMECDPTITVRPCEATDKNVVYINLCPRCVKGTPEKQDIYFTVTTNAGTFTSPVNNLGILASWKRLPEGKR